MGVFSRLADIVSSNLNATLDRAEDPRKMIRLMIAEMEETLVEVRQSAAKVLADKKTCERQKEQLARAAQEWRRRAEVAVDKNREDLAKAALAEKARAQEAEAALERELALLAEGAERFAADIDKLETKLAEAKAKRKAMEAREAKASSHLKVRRTLNDKRLEEAFGRFERMERRMDRLGGELEAEDLGRGKSLADEIDELVADQGVEDELAAIKARLAERRAADQA